tara:strand:- start:113 stop:565 length:453 start_codon:yes stop_codon:yes gene_type:complete
MGSDQRFDYSVLGDSVNLASRLEGQSKSYGVKTVLGPETHEEVKDEFATLKLDLIAVKGKKEAVSIFTLVGDNKILKSKDFQTLKYKHQKILDSYFNQKWDDALKNINNTKNLCNNVMTDYYKIMIERIEEFQNNPLPRDWDGVYIAKSK